MLTKVALIQHHLFPHRASTFYILFMIINTFCYFLPTLFCYLIKWYKNFCFRTEFCPRQSPVNFEILKLVNITCPILKRCQNSIGLAYILDHKYIYWTTKCPIFHISIQHISNKCVKKANNPTQAFRTYHLKKNVTPTRE